MKISGVGLYKAVVISLVIVMIFIGALMWKATQSPVAGGDFSLTYKNRVYAKDWGSRTFVSLLIFSLNTFASTNGGGVLRELSINPVLLDNNNFQPADFETENGNTNELVCDAKDDAREKAGLPLHKLVVNLENQVTTLHRENGSEVHFVTLDKVGSVVAIDRAVCKENANYYEDRKSGFYNFNCSSLVVSFQYSFVSRTGIFGERLNGVSRAFAVKNCEMK